MTAPSNDDRSADPRHGDTTSWRGDAAIQRTAFDAEASTVGARMFAGLGDGRTWLKKLRWLRQRVWSGNPSGRFLELGGGEGPPNGVAASLYPERLVVADPAHRALNRAAERWRQVSQAPAIAPTRVAAFGEELPFRDGVFDGVFGIDTLHHLASPRQSFIEAGRVLRPGGVFAFVESNPLHPANLLLVALSPIERGIYDLTARNLASWANDAGLVDLEVDNVPTFFPSFPIALGATFERLESLLDRAPLVRRLSTGRSVVARAREAKRATPTR